MLLGLQVVGVGLVRAEFLAARLAVVGGVAGRLALGRVRPLLQHALLEHLGRDGRQVGHLNMVSPLEDRQCYDVLLIWCSIRAAI